MINSKRLVLRNLSKGKVLTMRYGDGNNKMLQINPGQEVPLPEELSKGLLKSYLHLFKGELITVDLDQEEEDKQNAQTDGSTEGQNTENEAGESSEEAAGDEAGEDASANKEAKSEDDSDKDQAGFAGLRFRESLGEDQQVGSENSEATGEVDGQNSEEGNAGESNSQPAGDAEEGTGESEPIKCYTEKELKAMSAGEIERLAVKWGIDITTETTKKAQIAVILNKQEN